MGSSRSSDEAIHEPKRLRLPSNDDTTDYGKVMKSDCSSSDSSGYPSGKKIINLD